MHTGSGKSTRFTNQNTNAWNKQQRNANRKQHKATTMSANGVQASTKL